MLKLLSSAAVCMALGTRHSMCAHDLMCAHEHGPQALAAATPQQNGGDLQQRVKQLTTAAPVMLFIKVLPPYLHASMPQSACAAQPWSPFMALR